MAANDQWGSAATLTSDDGNHVVGIIYPSNDRAESIPGVWTKETGFVPLQEMLVQNYGLAEELAGWRLYRVLDMTGDFRFLTGTAINPNGNWEGFVIELPVLAGDYNRDGTVDAADYILWRNGLGTDYTQADYAAWRANFGATAAGAAAVIKATVNVAVPETTAMLLAGLALFVCQMPGPFTVLFRRRR